ncbi:MAG: hypothetical protein AB1762_08955, partial [Gemmatimonadota bacterium]
MTAIIVLAGSEELEQDALVRGALRQMRPRASELAEVWVDHGVALGVVADRWEVGQEVQKSGRLAVDDRAAVVTDASLYYAAELVAALRAHGAQMTSAAPA